jgi:hypothetical protein
MNLSVYLVAADAPVGYKQIVKSSYIGQPQRVLRLRCPHIAD